MTLERLTFPPVNPTRRRFLSVAAGGTVAAAAITTTAHATVPQLDEISPALDNALWTMARAREELSAAVTNMVLADDRIHVAWNADNPEPVGERRLRRWTKARERYRIVRLTAAWNLHREAEEAYRAAQQGLSLIRVTSQADLRVKACCAVEFDKEELSTGSKALISYGLAIDVALLNLAVQS